MAKGVKLSSFKTDGKKETEGVWYDFGAGCQLKISRNTRPEFREYTTTSLRPLIKALRSGRISQTEIEQVKKITREGYAKFILLDWKGLLDDAGNEIPFTYDRALEALSIDDFFEEVRIFAEDADNFRKDVIEESAKN